MRIDYKASSQTKERAEVKKDALIKALRSITPEQAAQWVEANVTNFAEAKSFLKTVARVVTFIAKRDL